MKYINNEREMSCMFQYFAVPIMEHMGIATERTEKWWNENKGDAKRALAAKRASVTGAVKIAAKSKP
jgi:hypothetical protein